MSIICSGNKTGQRQAKYSLGNATHIKYLPQSSQQRADGARPANIMLSDMVKKEAEQVEQVIVAFFLRRHARV